MEFEDVLYEAGDGVATITINRPKQLNAFRGQTVDELVQAFHEAWRDRAVGCAILTGAGDKAFCVGGDQTTREEGGYKVSPRARTLGSISKISIRSFATSRNRSSLRSTAMRSAAVTCCT